MQETDPGFPAASSLCPVTRFYSGLPYCVGTVLSHRMPDGQEKPVGFLSWTLSPASRGIILKLKKGGFGMHVCWEEIIHPFTLQADHKPLMSLFNESKAVPPQANG